MTHVQENIELMGCNIRREIKYPVESVRKDSGIESDDCCRNAINNQIHYSKIDVLEVHFQPRLMATIQRTNSYESVIESTEEEDSIACSEESHTRSEDHEEIRSDRSESVASDGSEEGGRDSGIEAERELDMVIPDRDTTHKIVDQVELYFSDENVTKDKFLLKHIRRNKEGYVSLKLVSSFKKVKQITKDWRVVSYALLKGSSNIQINDEGTKIRRVQPLPQIDDSPVTCAVLALDLPLDTPSIENVSRLFSLSSDITFIRVLRAGGNLPPDVKSYLTKYPELGQKHCAWIEFETPESAKNATQLSEGQMKVVLIVPESQKKHEKQKQQQKVQTNRRNSVNIYKMPNNKYQSYSQTTYRKNSFNKIRSNEGFSDSSYRRPVMQRRKAISLPSSHLPNISELSAQNNTRRAVRPKSKSCVEFSPSGAPCTSWVQRHLMAAAAASAASAASPTYGSRSQPPRFGRLSSGSLPLPEGVLRFPKGPDTSRGFGRSR